jgi:hypothetical protein
MTFVTLTYRCVSTNSLHFIAFFESRFSVFAQQQQGEETAPKKEDSFEAELCKDKDAGEWFRLVAGEGDNCRDVIQCTSSVSKTDERTTFTSCSFNYLAWQKSTFLGHGRISLIVIRLQGLQAIRCPAGLYFDIDKQTCDWKDSVKNCKLKNKERKVKPLLITDEPLCPDGSLACGDGNCIERGLFCNGEKDCSDGSDENSCGKDRT